MNVLARWHEVVTQKDPTLLEDLISDDCVFHSPIVHTPQEGKAITIMYLTAAMDVLTMFARSVTITRRCWNSSANVRGSASTASICLPGTTRGKSTVSR